MSPRISILTAPLSRCGFGSIRCGGGYAGGRCDRLFGDLFGDPLNPDVLVLDNGPDGIAEIAQQVPAVSDLNSARRALAHAVCVSASTVTCNDLDTGVLAKPRSQRFCLPVRQKVYDLIALQVDQNGPVAMTASPSPVINSKHAWRRWLFGGWCRSCHP